MFPLPPPGAACRICDREVAPGEDWVVRSRGHTHHTTCLTERPEDCLDCSRSPEVQSLISWKSPRDRMIQKLIFPSAITALFAGGYFSTYFLEKGARLLYRVTIQPTSATYSRLIENTVYFIDSLSISMFGTLVLERNQTPSLKIAAAAVGAGILTAAGKIIQKIEITEALTVGLVNATTQATIILGINTFKRLEPELLNQLEFREIAKSAFQLWAGLALISEIAGRILPMVLKR